MHRTSVTSSNICALGYDAQSAVLEVEFTSGEVYQYFSVPAHLHQELMSAASKGNFLHGYIRDRYRYRKVG